MQNPPQTLHELPWDILEHIIRTLEMQDIIHLMEADPILTNFEYDLTIFKEIKYLFGNIVTEMDINFAAFDGFGENPYRPYGNAFQEAILRQININYKLEKLTVRNFSLESVKRKDLCIFTNLRQLEINNDHITHIYEHHCLPLMDNLEKIEILKIINIYSDRTNILQYNTIQYTFKT